MRSIVRCLLAACALMLAFPAPTVAQGKPEDAFAKAMFDPQLVLKHAQTIGLSAQQRRAILDELKTTQQALVPLQVDMTEPGIELVELLEATKIDEGKAMARIEQVLKVENEVKKRQAVFLIRVKNLLTPEQQARLRAIRDGESKDDAAPGAPMPDESR